MRILRDIVLIEDEFLRMKVATIRYYRQWGLGVRVPDAYCSYPHLLVYSQFLGGFSDWYCIFSQYSSVIVDLWVSLGLMRQHPRFIDYWEIYCNQDEFDNL
jgi:hypothetical protein